MRKRRKYFIIASVVILFIGVLTGASIAALSDNSTSKVKAFDNPTPGAGNRADVQSLAASVNQKGPWDTSRTASNKPVTAITSQATDLLTGLGPDNDTLTAFPTSSGGVCFQVRGSGACGTVNNETGIWVAFIGAGNETMLVGVAADQVISVEDLIDGVSYPVELKNNGFYLRLPDGTANHAQQVIAHWDDGTSHTLNVPAIS